MIRLFLFMRVIFFVNKNDRDEEIFLFDILSETRFDFHAWLEYNAMKH